MASLVIPGGVAPSNLHLRPGITARYIDGDLYNICQRIKEIDPRLAIVQLDDGDDCAFAIMEHCDDGVERLVFRVRELDGRVLEKLRYLMAMPLHDRLKKLEADEYKAEADAHEEMHEMLYEKLGRPMWTELERCGFIDTRPVSYPKSGVTGGKGSRGKST